MRREHDVERARRLGLVDRDQAAVEALARRAVLLAQELEPLALQAEELLQPREPDLVQVEVAREHVVAQRDVADLRLERADARGHLVDLLRQARLLRPRGGDASLHLAQLAAVVAGRRSGQREARHADDGQATTHGRRFGGTSDVPAERP